MATTAPEVTLKPQAVEVKQPDAKKIDLPPYHTEETFKIAQAQAKKIDAQKSEDYTFSANGYTVTAKKADGTETQIADEDGMVYVISGNKLDERVLGSKRQAEVWVETHAASFADQSATMPSA